MLFFYQTKRAAHRSTDESGVTNKSTEEKNTIIGGNKMVGIIAVAGILAVSGALTYEFEEKIAPKEK